MGTSKGKIGIITLPSLFNYGNRLQNYAVTDIFQRLGYKPESLVLSKRPNAMRLLRSVYYGMKGRGGSKKPEELMSAERIHAFERFNEYIPMRHIKTLGNGLRLDYSYFSVGSDQVWNPGYMAYDEDFYLLEFCTADQRIALAASIGVDKVSPESGKRIGRAVSEFKGVSVREGRAADILRQYAECKPLVVCDPTLVLSTEDWKSVADNRLTPSGRYVFTYLLGRVGSEAADVLDRVTCGGDVPVVPLSDRQKPEELDAGPAEFISLIDHAEHVVTDSFHAAVFASIMQTPLTIVHREGGESMFSRLEQLSKMLGIGQKIYGSPDFDLLRAGDYDGVPEAIERERRRFMEFLERCLDG